jgi:hypothetical protein
LRPSTKIEPYHPFGNALYPEFIFTETMSSSATAISTSNVQQYHRILSQPRVVSVRDLDYQIVPQVSYHPAFYYAGMERIAQQFPNLAKEIRHAFDLNAMKSVWGIVIEYNNTPLFVAQNISRVVNSPSFRRVLRIQVNPDYQY